MWLNLQYVCNSPTFCYLALKSSWVLAYYYTNFGIYLGRAFEHADIPQETWSSAPCFTKGKPISNFFKLLQVTDNNLLVCLYYQLCIEKIIKKKTQTPTWNFQILFQKSCQSI